MSKVSRSDVFVRDEKGADWFNDFLESYAENKEAYVQDVLDAMTGKQDKQADTVQSMVEKYREMVGLDILADEDEPELVVKASAPPISKRAKEEEEELDIVLLIEKDPQLKNDLESICHHSGGHKNTHSILNFLKERLGEDKVSFSDDNLTGYIDGIKDKYKVEVNDQYEPGKVGLEHQDSPEDQMADYIAHGLGK